MKESESSIANKHEEEQPIPQHTMPLQLNEHEQQDKQERAFDLGRWPPPSASSPSENDSLTTAV